jgi:hypothetical protein
MGQTPATSPNAVDTAKVDRRTLRFESIDEALAESDRLAAAERAGRLKPLGNWTLGQALGHLAAWADYAYTGAPLKVPFFVRWFVRLQKRKFLYGPMQAGVRIPRVEGGTLAIERLSLDDGLERFRRAMQRLKTEAPTKPSSVFGRLSHDESIALNLRHAELHLSFFVAE